MSKTLLSLDEVSELTEAILRAAGADRQNAQPVAQATMEAERDGIASHGLIFVPTYAEHLRCGKVDGKARPAVHCPRPGVVRVDAGSGFAQPAILSGEPLLIEAARRQGIACMAVQNSYNAGVLGQHVERIADAGLVGLGFANAPASIAPAGGKGAVIGTNPIALATPAGPDGQSLLIDQSASVIARSEIARHAAEGWELPAGWALDSGGMPTTDASRAMEGTVAPAGGYKGFGWGLITEVFAAALAGATLGINASQFRGTAGGPPRTGQFFVAIDPEATADGGFVEKLSALCDAIGSQGARVPGSRRRKARIHTRMIEVNEKLLATLRALEQPPA